MDFADRAVHEMTVAAKAIVHAFYETPPKLSYWNGCSGGGRQGLIEAQRFPWDYAEFRTLNASDPDLTKFQQRGGKLLLYHGWSDPNFSAQPTIDYYESLRAVAGAERIAEWARLFLAPGMGHCGGGNGPNAFDPITALEQSVEHGRAPQSILATHSTNGKVDRTRPLCPFPQVAKYNGTGSIEEAASFTCRLP